MKKTTKKKRARPMKGGLEAHVSRLRRSASQRVLDLELSPQERDREEMRRRLARTLKREKSIRQMTRQIRSMSAAVDHDLRELAVRVLFPEGVQTMDPGERAAVGK